MEQAAFLNMLRSLHNIDGCQLPELTWGQQIDFVQAPVKYFIKAEDDQQAAIFREIMKRQPLEQTYGGIPMSEHARSHGVAGWHPGDDA